MSLKSDVLLDAKGLACPMPIVKTKKEIDKMVAGQIIEIHATDKGAKNDMTAWAKSTGNELVANQEEDGVLKFWIKKV